jgi:hypothetical protein
MPSASLTAVVTIPPSHPGNANAVLTTALKRNIVVIGARTIKGGEW